jgi:hypothetical protein
MRTLIAIGLVALLTSAATASPAASKAANGRGMTLMGKKKWAEAEKEFKTAVAEDNSSVKAHYNLASAASRAQDQVTAVTELTWVLDRATWVDEAKSAASKVESDDDLAWILHNWDESVVEWVGKDAKLALIDLTGTSDTANAGHAGGDGKQLAAAPGSHDAKCDPKNAKQGKVFTLPLHAMLDWQRLSALASLRDGVALADTSGAIVARSEPLGCTGPGESQDQLASLAYARGNPVPGYAGDTPPIANLQLLVVTYTNGGHREWQTNVALFTRNDKTIAKVFENTIANSDSSGAGHLWQSPLGHLIYTAPGDTKKHAYEWDPKAFKFVAMP